MTLRRKLALIGLIVIGAVGVNLALYAANSWAQGMVPASASSGSSTGTNTGDVTLSAVGAAPNANGATLSGQVLNLEPASGSRPGVVTTGSQVFSGDKTIDGGLLLTDTLNVSVRDAGVAIEIPTHSRFCFDSDGGCANYMMASVSDSYGINVVGSKMLTPSIESLGGYLSYVASSNIAFGVVTNGAKIDFGAGANDHAVSDGTTVAFAGPISTAGAFTASTTATVGTDPAIASASGTNDSALIGLANLTRRAQPNFIGFKKSVLYTMASTTGTTYSAVGGNNPTSTCVSGTVAADAASDPTQQLISMTTQASSSATCHVASAFAAPGLSRWTHLPKFGSTVFMGSSIATERVWAGMAFSDLSGSDTGTQRKAAFRYSTGAGDTNWMACTSDGTTASCTSTGVAVVLSTAYTLEVDCATATTCNFYVNGALTPQVAKTTNVPNASNTDLGWQVAVTTLSAGASVFETGKIAFYQN